MRVVLVRYILQSSISLSFEMASYKYRISNRCCKFTYSRASTSIWVTANKSDPLRLALGSWQQNGTSSQQGSLSYVLYNSSIDHTHVLFSCPKDIKSDYLSVLIVQTSWVTPETPSVFVKYHKNQVALTALRSFYGILRLRLLVPTPKI